MRILLVLFFFLVCPRLFAQAPKSYPSSEIFQQIKKLDVLGSVLYLAAHPDDENTRLIAWLSNERLYRTAYLSMTRGDGGQNLIGDEQGVELGLIRTQELLSARRIDGGEQFFTRAFDFGYTKSPEETFKFWNKEKILSDVVWVIRKFRPDIIITRFPTTGEGGHGHHTASAILAGEAFEAAGDSTRFPEQLKDGVTTWRPKRLLWNTFNFGSNNTIKKDQFKIDAGGYNPLLGESIGEIAAHSRSQHKSQGFGVSASRGVQFEHFKTIKGDAPKDSLFDGVDISWDRIHAQNVADLTSKIENDFLFEHPEKSVSQLLKLYETIDNLQPGYWRDQKLKEVKQLIIECSGLFMEAYTRQQFFVPGKEMNFYFSADNRLGVPVTVSEIKFNSNNLNWTKKLERDETIIQSLNTQLPASIPISQPYWLQYPMSKGSFTVKDQKLIGKPENDPLYVHVILDFNGIKISYELTLKYKSNDPVKGEVYQPVFIIPAAEIRSSPAIALSKNKVPVGIDAIVSKNDSSLVVRDIITNQHPDVKKSVENGKNVYIVNKKNQEEPINFSVKTNEGIFNQYKVLISYSHIPDIIYFPDATSKLVGVDLKISGNNAGYIPGAGDKIPEALEQMGYSVTTLKAADFSLSNLKKFDVIVTGVRAYNIHVWLNDVYPALMEYVKNGGVLFVQYNTNNNIGPVKAKIGPYPFDISRNRVTDEDAAVTFTDTKNSLLNYPNTITQSDFKDWIQERSTYHAANFDQNYRTLFSMHDPNENPDKGSLIYCDYGKGRFIYSGLVFFRELPAGNPGAYRLFSNLIAKPEK